MSVPRGGWFTTATGRRLYVLDPDPEQVVIEDIAHALSHICRWGGHVLTFYSVAEHCLRASSIVPRGHALHALLHDATEAYLGDVITPLKRTLPDYKDLEHRWWLAIASAFCVAKQMPESVKIADTMMLELERRDLVSHGYYSGDVFMEQKFEWEPPVPPVGPKIVPLTSAEAKRLYLLRFYALTDGKMGPISQ
jgi:hypothetical protein